MSKPYEEYVDAVLSGFRYKETMVYYWKDGEVVRSEAFLSLSTQELHQLLTEAWMAGLKYSLVMIESEKRRRDEQD